MHTKPSTMVLIWVLAAFLGTIIGCMAYASGISQNRAVKAIIGEAENQGVVGMYAVACAIRNRGTLKGVYGLNAVRVREHKYSTGVYMMAQRQWARSAWDRDITGGANHWQGVHERASWTSRCKQTVVIKDHVFFKC